MPIIRPCLSKVVTETLLVSKIAISVAVATVLVATVVVKRSGRAKSRGIATILLLFALAFLLLRFRPSPVIRLADSAWKILSMRILGVPLHGIALGCVRIVAHGLLFAFETIMAAVASVRPAVLLELSRFDFVVGVRSLLGSASTATAAASATASAAASIVIFAAGLLLISSAASTSSSTIPSALVVGVAILLVRLLVWLLVWIGGNGLL